MTDSRGNKVVVCDNGTGVSCARWELWGGSDLGAHTVQCRAWLEA